MYNDDDPAYDTMGAPGVRNAAVLQLMESNWVIEPGLSSPAAA